MLRTFLRLRFATVVASWILLLGVSGCARDNATSPMSDTGAQGMGPVAVELLGAGQDGRTVIRQDGSIPPAELASATFGDQTLRLWPYTGHSFDGQGVDPVNLIFVGDADPARIRDALLSLDGDRTALGFPPAYPFDQRWKDAMGDVQTGYAEPAGWAGSEIQLALGNYEPVRFHLRLFRTAKPFGEHGSWTVGAAHFELLIPGTYEHQILSWERAEQIVIADLMRSGLLDATVPMVPAGGIGPTPSWRAIEPFIYNELPQELIDYIGGPPKPVSTAVPIPNDGNVMILQLANHAAPAGSTTDMFTQQFHQMVPKPFCSAGPYDYVMIDGPVSFWKGVTVGPDGTIEVEGRLSGTLTVTPMDESQNPPVPMGPSWTATIGDMHSGTIFGQAGRIQFQTKRILPQDSGTEMQMTRLAVASQGQDSYTLRERCLSEELTAAR